MNLNTNTIISSRYPIKNIRTITNYYLKNDKSVYIKVEPNREVPIYTLDAERLFIYNYDNSSYKYNSYLLPLEYYDTPIKVLGEKFYTCFAHLNKFRKYSVATKSYYIGKGIITDDLFNPLLLTTYHLDIGDLDRYNYEHNAGRTPTPHFDQSKLKIYLSRKIFTEEFREQNKKLHKELFNVIIPKLMELEIPITVKTELNMLTEVFVDPSLTINQLQDKFKIEAEHAKRNIIGRIQ